MDSAYKFKPGQLFKLTPTARIKWLAFSNHTGSGIDAVRCDSEIGSGLLRWMAEGSDTTKTPFSYSEIRRASQSFWPSHLEQAVLSK